MVEITMFSDSVKCAHCHETDMYNGLKRVNGRWTCKRCAQNPPPITTQPQRDAIENSKKEFLS